MAEPNLDALLVEAPGFGKCRACPYLSGGSAALCYRCARRTMEPLADPLDRCAVCDQTFAAGETACKNPVCSMSERWFEWDYAIAIRSGRLEAAINAYKFNGATGWAAIFGRILVGFLEANAETFRSIDLIVPSPTYTGSGSRRSWNHIYSILVAADREQTGPRHWPFDLTDPPAIVKVTDTPPMSQIKRYQERRQHAETVIRVALDVPDSARTRGARIVVVDDIFTDGLTLREVARTLRLQGGAARVYGVSLARQPYRR